MGSYRKFHEKYLSELSVSDANSIVDLYREDFEAYGYTAPTIADSTADGNFISTYARDYPNREDVAESFPMYYAQRYKPTRIPQSLRETIIKTMPNRILYFDKNLPGLEPKLP